jgi:hypothetical protein
MYRKLCPPKTEPPVRVHSASPFGFPTSVSTYKNWKTPPYNIVTFHTLFKGKGKKVKLSLYLLTEHHIMKTYWGVEV